MGPLPGYPSIAALTRQQKQPRYRATISYEGVLRICFAMRRLSN
jgi:hypothetical protein